VQHRLLVIPCAMHDIVTRHQMPYSCCVQESGDRRKRTCPSSSRAFTLAPRFSRSVAMAIRAGVEEQTQRRESHTQSPAPLATPGGKGRCGRHTFVCGPHERSAPVLVRLIERERARREKGGNLVRVARAHKVPDVVRAFLFVPGRWPQCTDGEIA
jgi:hypothetical protein